MRHPILVLTLLLTFAAPAAAQPKDASPTQSKVSKEKSAREIEAERLLKERRAHAQSLLINLAADARNFNEALTRGRTLARVAYVLWDSDPERARSMFRIAWDAAEAADKEAVARAQQEMRQAKAKGSRTFGRPSPQLRREIIGLAAKRDRALGEEFLAKLKEQTERDNAGAKMTQPSPLGLFDPTINQRLDVAGQLLDADQVEAACQFADAVLGIVTQRTVDFITNLRDKNAAAADERYAAMLATAAANPQSDANTASLLSSYLFTPHVYFGFTNEGTYTNSYQGSTSPRAVNPQLQLAFFRAAASILLRPLAPPGEEQNTAGHDGHYLVIKRLMPVFEKSAPPELTNALRAQLEALTALVTKTTRDRDDDDMVRSGIRPDNMLENWEQSLHDRLDHAKTSAERDRLNFELATLFAGKGELRARDYVEKIDDTELRNDARTYIDIRLTRYAISRKDVDRIMELIHTAELDHIHKTWLLTQGAKLLAKSDSEKALILIDLALAEARRISPSDADAPRAFLAAVNAMFAVNRAAVSDMMSETVKSLNSAEDFSGEGGGLSFRVDTKAGLSWTSQESVPDFDVDGIFKGLAEYDYDKAVEVARGLNKDAPRALATIAIARTVLEAKK